MIYDGFGNRVSKTANGVTTKYLVEDEVQHVAGAGRNHASQRQMLWLA
jgi:hypothetical protein